MDSKTKLTKEYLTHLTYKINGAAIEVHRNLGPGLTETIYHKCMVQELTFRGINFVSEANLPIKYKSIPVGDCLRCDLLIEKCIVVELKAVESLLDIHRAQLLTYMKLLEVPKGILLNFNCKNLFHYGQETFVNRIYSELDDE